MAAPDSKTRVKDAITLLDYGFGKCVKYMDEGIEKIGDIPVEQGVEKKVRVKQKEMFQYIDTEGNDLTQIEKKFQIKKSIAAPVKQGDVVGKAEYYIGQEKIGSVDVIATRIYT